MSRVSHLLNKTASISRLSRVWDGQGHVETFAVLYASVKTRFFAASGKDRMLGQQAGADISHTAYFEPDQDVQRGDLIGYGGDNYEVLYVLDPSETHHRKVALRISRATP